MTKKLFPNLVEKAKTGFWWLSQGANLEKVIFYSVLLLLPTQFGRHFWPEFSYVYGIRIDYLSPTVYVTDILIILLFFIALLGRKKIRINKVLLLFFVYLAASTPFIRNWQVGIYGLLKVFEFSFFSIYLASVFRKENLIKILSVPFLFESLLSIWQFFNKGSIGSVFYLFGERTFNGQTPGIANASLNGELILRPYGTFSHPNVLAGFLLIIVTLIIFSFKKLKPFYLTLLAIGSIALFLTLSRIAILIFLIIIAIKFFLLLKQRKNFLLNSLLYFFILIFSLSLVFISSFNVRFLNFSLNESSIVLRWQLLNAAFEMFLKNPVIGVGLNGFLPNLPDFIIQQKTFFVQPVHNIYLLILSQIGVVGFSFFLFLLFKTFRKILKIKNYLSGILLIEILILGAFDHYFLTLQQGQLLLALIIGLSFSRLRLNIQ